MITVTDAAKEHLAQALESNQEEEGAACFRLVKSEDDRLAMVLGEQLNEDEVVEHDGKAVLALDGELAPVVEGRTLDIEENPEGEAVLTLK